MVLRPPVASLLSQYFGQSLHHRPQGDRRIPRRRARDPELDPLVGGFGPRGDLGWTVGNFASQVDGQAFHGKYMTVWQKEKTGAWKFVQDGGSGNPPPGP